MDDLNPQIPLQAGQNIPNFGPDPNAMLAFLKVQQQRQQNTGYNAMAELYRDPANLQNGMLKPEAIAKAIAAGQLSPQIGLDTMGKQAEIGQHQLAAQANQLKITESTTGYLDDVMKKAGDPASIKYQQDIASGIPPEQAKRNAQAVYTDKYNELKTGGLVPPEIMQRVSPSFDPDAYLRNRQNLDEILKRQQIEKDKRSDLDLKETYRREDAWAVQEDTRPDGTTIKYRYNKLNGQSTDLSGNPYTPSGLAAPKGPEGQLYTGEVTDDKGKHAVTVRMGPTGGFVDAQTGQAVTGLGNIRKVGTKAEQDESTMGQPTGPADLHGEDYLKALPSNRTSQIKGYAEGKLQLPGSFSMKTPYWIKMLADIQQYDPTFEQADFARRAKTMQAYTTGPEARNVTSFNTALGHLANAYRSGDALVKSEVLGGTFKPLNWLEQSMKSAVGNDARIKRFGVDVQALASEMERAFRGTGGNVTEIEAWKQKMSSVDTPETMHAVLQEAANLLASRIAAVNENFRRGMGPRANLGELLTPHARRVYDAIEKGEVPTKEEEVPPKAASTPLPGGGATAPVPPAPAAARPAASAKSAAPREMPVPPAFRDLPDGRPLLGPDGVTRWVKKGDKLIEMPASGAEP